MVDELSNVLWAYHTIPWEPTGETPFKLSFEMEVVIPIEILSKTLKMKVKQLNIIATSAKLCFLEGVK